MIKRFIIYFNKKRLEKIMRELKDKEIESDIVMLTEEQRIENEFDIMMLEKEIDYREALVLKLKD